ncbi:MAG: putative oxidoreductase [Ilumatobacteraceae bacterium]|nr:putative oxidoreductase [Ilumatobacteraceae bacterium]
MGETFDIAAIDHLLTTTRAVRKRLDLTRPVERDLILDCIRVATQAPAGGNVQRWRWIVIDDPALKQGIADLYRRSYAPYMAAQRAEAERLGRTDTAAIMSSSDHLAEILDQVPALVIPCSLGAPVGSQGMVAGFYGSILPAVWNFMLAAKARGLGTAWTTLHLEYEAEARELLGIPSTVTQVALTPVAYYTGDSFKPGTRRAAEEITYFNGWKS